MPSAIKLISMLRGGRSAAWRQWLDDELAQTVPGLTRLVFNEVRPVAVRSPKRDDAEGWSSVLEAWFDSDGDADQWAARVNGHGFSAHLFVAERLVYDSGLRPLPAKVIVAFRRRGDLSRREALAHWQGRHVEVGLVDHRATDFLRLYFQNHVLDKSRAADPAYDYDGLPEYWLDEADLAEVGAESPVMRAIAEDEENFIDRESIVTLLVQEDEVFVRSGSQAGWPIGAGSIVDA